MKRNKRVTIGFLVSGITDSFTEYMCRGVIRAAEEADVNLVILPGKYINRNLDDNREIMFEYQHNTIFSYARKDNLDALVIAADCIGVLTSKANVVRFLKEYDGIPCVLLASKIDGYISVNYDNENGIRQGMEYLIDSLHCRKIGMIGGPEDNTDARERKQVFLNVLQEHNIPFEERFYVEGNLSKADNPAGRLMLDCNPDVEAVFCVNDDSALALYKEMENRGLVPGKDIKIFGFDDTIYAAKAKPSLSSVWADPEDLGQRAVEMVLERLRGVDVSNEVLKTRLIKRNSLRDVSENERRDIDRFLDLEYIDEFFNEIFYRYNKRNLGTNGGIVSLQNTFRDMMTKILTVVPDGMKDTHKYDEIIQLVDRFLNQDALKYADIDNLLTYFIRVYQAIKMSVERIEGRYEYGRLLSEIYRKIIYAMDYRFSQVEDDIVRSRYSMKFFVKNILQFDRGNDQSYSMLLNNLEWLGIRNAYLYTFAEPIIHLYKEKFQLPEKMYLKAVLTQGESQSISATQQEIAVADIFNHEHMSKDRHSMVLFPLFFNEMMYGVILCDMTEMLFENGDFFADHLSSAVKMIVTLRANENIQQQLEESLVTLREHNIELDNLSKSDGLTGIRNRRGFNDAAQKLVAANQQSGKDTLVAYVDMNNLKIINDRYGHDEGDFSLKLIGDLLVEIMGPEGIVGRIGGDEFACVKEYSGNLNGDDVVLEIAGRFAQYNFNSPKPFNVTVSTGAYVLSATDEFGLEEALSLADEQLYIAKQSRMKTVAKTQPYNTQQIVDNCSAKTGPSTVH